MNILPRQIRSFLYRTGEAFRGYDRVALRDDLLAGLSVGVVAVPQAMAYAIIAEVPPVYGLYTLILQCALGAVFSSHPLLSLGPVNSQSLVVASIVTRLQSPGDGAAYLSLVVTLTLIKGLLQLGMAGLRIGRLTRYVSRSVIVGFTAGAGVLIAAKQVGPFLGFATPRLSGDWPGIVGIGQQVVRGLAEVNPVDLMLGGISLLMVSASRIVSRRIPGPLIAVVVCALIVAWFGFGEDDIKLLGALPVWPDSWPLPQLHPSTLERLIPAGLALALLGSIETHAIAKSLAQLGGSQGARHRGRRPRVSSNQDLLGHGITHVITAFLACIPGSASLSRSALNQSSGGRTLLSNLVNAGFVALSLVLFADAARYVPLAAIAGILLFIAWGLIDWAYIVRVVRTTKADTSVLASTFIATLTIPLEYAVFVGITLNIALYLQRATQLQMREVVVTDGGPFAERPVTAESGERNVTFLQLEGSLFFAQAEELEDQLQTLLHSPVRVVIFRLRRVHSVDATILGVFEQFVGRIRGEGRHVVLCGVHEKLLQKLADFGLVDLIGPENVFPTDTGVFASAEAAIERADQLLESPRESPTPKTGHESN